MFAIAGAIYNRIQYYCQFCRWGSGKTMRESFASVLASYADARPKTLAVRYANEQIDWSTLLARASQWAALLRLSGVARDDLVMIALPNGVKFHEVLFGVWCAGATPCPISSKMPERELRQIVDLVQPRLLVSHADRRLDGVRHIDVETSLPDPGSEGPDCYARCWKAVTSGGSTGVPKVIVDRGEARLTPKIAGLMEMLTIPRGGVLLNPGPLYHNGPFLFTSLALLAGTTVIGMPRFDAEETLALIERHRVQWVCLVPTMMHRIWSLSASIRKKYDLSSLKFVWHMAAACPPWLKRAWIDWLGPDVIFELYAGTEGGGTLISGAEWLAKPGSVGRVRPDTLTIRDEKERLCGPGEIGEIFFPAAGRQEFDYIGSPLKTDSSGRFSLGDLGHIDEDGYLFLADRRLDLVIRGGANIYPAEVEAILDQFPGVSDAVVVGLPCAEYGERVHAILACPAAAQPDVVELDAFMRSQLAGYKCPESYEFVSEPLRNEAGKVRRSQLKAEREAWLNDGVQFRHFVKIQEVRPA